MVDSSQQQGVGRVLAVCVGSGGIPKPSVKAASVSTLGLDQDGHRFEGHGGANRAVCLFFTNDYATLRSDGVDCEAPGTFGENLLVEGIDPALLRAQDCLQIGDVLLEIHDIREPCHTLKRVDQRFPDLMVGRSGYVCRVLESGVLRTGDSVIVTPHIPDERTEFRPSPLPIGLQSG
jgi:MOSC domain-containing protein YiiM